VCSYRNRDSRHGSIRHVAYRPVPRCSVRGRWPDRLRKSQVSPISAFDAVRVTKPASRDCSPCTACRRSRVGCSLLCVGVSDHGARAALATTAVTCARSLAVSRVVGGGRPARSCTRAGHVFGAVRRHGRQISDNSQAHASWHACCRWNACCGVPRREAT
jgi:hypothetical protein